MFQWLTVPLSSALERAWLLLHNLPANLSQLCFPVTENIDDNTNKLYFLLSFVLFFLLKTNKRFGGTASQDGEYSMGSGVRDGFWPDGHYVAELLKWKLSWDGIRKCIHNIDSSCASLGGTDTSACRSVSKGEHSLYPTGLISLFT